MVDTTRDKGDRETTDQHQSHQASRAPDFSQAVLDDLYSYKSKSNKVAWGLCLLLGILGAHRFYVGRTFSGLAMLLSGGGGGIWWLWDFSQLKNLVSVYNQEEGRRKQDSLPPQSLGFLPNALQSPKEHVRQNASATEKIVHIPEFGDRAPEPGRAYS